MAKRVVYTITLDIPDDQLEDQDVSQWLDMTYFEHEINLVLDDLPCKTQFNFAAGADIQEEATDEA